MVSLVIHKTRMMSESQQVCYDKICRLTKIAWSCTCQSIPRGILMLRLTGDDKLEWDQLPACSHCFRRSTHRSKYYVRHGDVILYPPVETGSNLSVSRCCCPALHTSEDVHPQHTWKSGFKFYCRHWFQELMAAPHPSRKKSNSSKWKLEQQLPIEYPTLNWMWMDDTMDNIMSSLEVLM